MRDSQQTSFINYYKYCEGSKEENKLLGINDLRYSPIDEQEYSGEKGDHQSTPLGT